MTDDHAREGREGAPRDDDPADELARTADVDREGLGAVGTGRSESTASTTSDEERPDEPPPPTVAPSAVRAATGEGAVTDESAEASESARRARSMGPGDALGVEVDPVPSDETAEADGADTATAGEDDEADGVEGAAGSDDEPGRRWRAVPLSTRLEAILFASPEPLTLRRLRKLAGDEAADDVRDALDSLQAHYDASARAFSLVEIGGGYQLRTRAELSELLSGTGRRSTTEKLSPAAVETLAIVAYRQPVLRVDVEKIRGVSSGEILRGLIEKGLVRVAGRAELPGSPLLYGTTPLFLELFGLRNLKDLPSDRTMLRRPM